MAHGIMFHHFHGPRHPAGQGALSAAQLGALLADVQQQQHILPAQEWLERACAGTLHEEDRCLTFDDALLCQYEIALPVLQQHHLSAFWFVYSSVFLGHREMLEIYRHFRSVCFAHIDLFYQEFFQATVQQFPACQPHLHAAQAQHYLAEFTFYSTNDRIFRFLRDEILSSEQYAHLMQILMQQHHYDPQQAAQQLWMQEDHLLDLQQQGHVIGLHSFSHPTRLGRLSRAQQWQEYQENFRHLSQLLGAPPRSMAHPCNSYNQDTLNILQEMGIQLGFRSNRAALPKRTPLEWPREDHIHLLPTPQPAV
ncbi:MAG: polysaccharide deacetylase family protein [Magnetococcales bacterium]|nr:polysaccharide deacetylase family protein [Magnetococcales bacterium]MBF0114198.1 polysaccharide deacetylase family protein [Magnetococcales bacterium]